MFKMMAMVPASVTTSKAALGLIAGVVLFLLVPGLLRAQVREAPCEIDLQAEVEPSRVLVGEAATVTVSTSVSCPGVPARQNLVLLFEESGSMAGDRNRETKKGGRAFVNDLGMDGSLASPLSVGVVTFNSVARILCALTSRSGTVNGCIGRVGAAGGTDLPQGLRTAQSVLVTGRATRGWRHEAILVIGDPEMTADTCPAAVDAVRDVIDAGINLGIVCLSDDCHQPCLRDRLPTSVIYRFASDALGMAGAITETGAALIALPGDGAAVERIVRLHPSGGAPIVPGSISTSPNSRAGGLTWRHGQMRPPGVVATTPFTITFSVRPEQPGSHAAFDRAVVAVLDPQGRSAQADLVAPTLLALAPHVHPTDEPNAPPQHYFPALLNNVVR